MGVGIITILGNHNVLCSKLFSAKDGELLDLELGIILQVSNILFPDENSGVRCQ